MLTTKCIQVNLQIRALGVHSGEGDYLFHHRKGFTLSDGTGAFHATLRAAKIDDFHFHDLRHTFASLLPPDPYLRRDLLGHATVDTSAHYSYTSMKERRRAVENLSGAQVVEITRRADKKRVKWYAGGTA
jgi:integrase